MSVEAPRRSLTALIALTSLCLPILSFAQVPLPPAGGGSAIGQPPPPDVTKAAEQLTKAQKLQIAKKYAEAVAAYQEFIRLAKIAKIAPPPILSAYSNLAQCYQLLNDGPNYKATLHALLSLDPKNAKALAQLAIAAGAEHNFEEAEEYANKTLALKPEAGVAAAAHFVLGNVAISHKDSAGAAREFGQAAQEMPKNPLAHYNYGLALAQIKKYTAAQKEMETAIKLDPNNANARFYLAVIKRQMHPSTTAASPFEEILKKHPNDPEALKGRALDIDRMGPLHTSNAISAYLDAITVLPDWFEGHYNVARLYNSISNFTASKQHFIRAHEIAAQQKNIEADAQSLGELGFSELLEGPSLLDPTQKTACYKSAETHLKQALALNARETETKKKTAQENEFKIRLASVYENQGMFNDAVLLYRDLLKEEPDSTSIYSHLANVYKRQGKVDDYVRIWKEYQAHNPADPTSYQNIGDILRGTMQWDKAIAEWKLLLKVKQQTNSALSSTYMVIGQALFRRGNSGDFEEANTYYKTVLAMKPSVVPAKYQLQENATLEAEQYNALRGLADLAAKQNKTEESIQWLTLLLKQDEIRAKRKGETMSGEAYHDIALLYEKDKKLDLALNTYKEWTLALPNDPVPWEERGRLLDIQGHVGEAVSAYQTAVRLNKKQTKDPIPDSLKVAEVYQRHQMFDRGIVELEALHKANPTNKEIMTELGLMYRETHQEIKALPVYDALLAADPSQRWVLDQKALALTQLKRYDEAKALYVQQIDYNPFNRQTYADLALVYVEAGQKEGFLIWLKPRFEKSPANSTLMAVVYDEYVSRMQEAEGQKYIASVIDKVKPQRRAAQEGYAKQLQIHKHNAECLEVYRTIAKENPKDMNAWMNLADQLDFAGEPEEANKIHLDQIARTDISDLDRFSLKRQQGLRYMKQGKMEEAQALFEALHTQTPTNFDVAMTLGAVISRRDHDDEALAYYQKLLDISSYPLVVRVDIHLRLGMLYEKENKKPEAEKEYHEVLQLDTQNTPAMEALKKLEGH